MDELVKLVQQKTGLQEAQAKQAVETVLGFLKERLPAPIASQLEAALSNESVVDQASDLLKKGSGGLGGLLGK